MCIRDSIIPALLIRISMFSVFARIVDIASFTEVSFVTSISVSYTHLRAHETVLDLVCRLLLEKKKVLVTPHLGATALSTFYLSQNQESISYPQ